jgi:type IV secretory pathway VirB4 component
MTCQRYSYKLNIIVEKKHFNELMSHFHKYAEDYTKTNGRPPVLVIDNVNRLADKDPKLLDEVQDIAKTATDKKCFLQFYN